MLVKLSQGLRSKAARVDLQTLPWYVKQKEWRLIVRGMSGVRWVSRITTSQQGVPLFPQTPMLFRQLSQPFLFLSSARRVSPLCQNLTQRGDYEQEWKIRSICVLWGCWRSDSQRWGFTWYKRKILSPHHTWLQCEWQGSQHMNNKNSFIVFLGTWRLIIRIHYLTNHKSSLNFIWQMILHWKCNKW